MKILLMGAASLLPSASFMFAKQGNVSSPSGNDPVIRAIADAEPVVDTLAGTLRTALGNAALPKIGLVHTGNRTVTVVPDGTDISAAIAGLALQTTITKDDPTKASSPMTGTAEGAQFTAAILAELAPAKPSFSVESILNRLEDVFAEIPGSAIIVVDQTAQEVRVYSDDDPADVNAIDPAAVLAEDAHFVQTLVAAGGAQFGE